uniref:Uncharacterized protein n=1 Tax=Echeneis naucrates TaxID=173247 RepID=A0A665X8L2_ECHNA
ATHLYDKQYIPDDLQSNPEGFLLLALYFIGFPSHCCFSPCWSFYFLKSFFRGD